MVQSFLSQAFKLEFLLLRKTLPANLLAVAPDRSSPKTSFDSLLQLVTIQIASTASGIIQY